MAKMNEYDAIAAKELSALLEKLGIPSEGLESMDSDEARGALSAVADMIEDAREADVLGDEVSSLDPEAKPDALLCGILRQLAMNKKFLRYMTSGTAPAMQPEEQKMEQPEMSESDIGDLLVARMK